MDRTCQYCKKEFHYPSVLKRHLRLKNMCSKQTSQANNQVNQIVNQANQKTNQTSQVTDQISLIINQISEKNMVPIWLILA